MLNYAGYLGLNLLKKKTTWAAAILFWLYICLVLLIVPTILGVSPIALWNNTIMDAQSFSIMLLAVVCAVLAVIIFRDGRDDGSELIIVSKPIPRYKLVVVKVLAFYLTTIFIVFIAILFMSITLAIDPTIGSKINGMMLSTFLGCVVIILLFGAIAILLSMITGKVGIMIGTIGITVVLNLFYMIAPSIATTPKKYLEDIQAVSMNSVRFLDSEGKLHNSVYASNTEQNPTEFWSAEAMKNSSSTTISILNVEQQLCDIFKAFGVESEGDVDMSAFGSNIKNKYTIPAEDSHVFPEGKLGDLSPLMMPRLMTTSEVKYLQYAFIGSDLTTYTIYSVLGAKSDSIAQIMKAEEDIGGIFFSFDDFIIRDETFLNGAFTSHLNEIYEWCLDPAIQQPSLETYRSKTSLFFKDNFATFKNICPNKNFDETKVYNWAYLATTFALAQKFSKELWNSYSEFVFDYKSFSEKYNSDINLQRIVNCANSYCMFSSPQSGFMNGDERKVVDDLYTQVSFSTSKANGDGSLEQLCYYKIDKLLPTQSIIIFWSTFAALVSVISIVVYTRTDFK